MSTAQHALSEAEFLSRLEQMKKRFEAMNPVFDVVVRDPDMGVEGYVVVHNTSISLNGPLKGEGGQGCGKGGTRITSEISQDEVRMLAHKMALKNAAAGLPLGGCKSGLKADPDAPDFEEKYRRFVELSKPFLFENGGCFGGFGFDIGARPEHPIWACDTLQSGRSFTGKPLDMGGTDYDKEGIAGYGVAIAALTALGMMDGHQPAHIEWSAPEQDAELTDEQLFATADKVIAQKAAKGKTFAVQGAGAMGAAVIKYFSGFGAKLTRLSDPRLGGCWHFTATDGADADILNALGDMNIEKARQLIESSAHAVKDSDDDAVLTANVDVLFPCAVQNVIHIDNVARVNARLIAEGANSPITDPAYHRLKEQGVMVVPDFIANPGGVIAAYVEMTTHVANEENIAKRIKPEKAKALSAVMIDRNVREMMDMVKAYDGIRPVDAGMMIALSRIGV